MRLRRFSARAIAAVINETVQTVEADLEWLRQQHQDQFGPAPTIDASQEIGWAVADFEEMESVAWLEFHALKQEAQQRRLSPMFVARARQGWIRTAAMMRVLRLKLLAEHGFLLPSMSSQVVGASVARADDIRALLRQEGLLLEVAWAGREKAVLSDTPAEGPDPMELEMIARWGDDGGFEPEWE